MRSRLRARDRVMVGLIAMTTVVALACVSRSTRGWWEHSSDGKTWLVIEDDNRTACRQIEIDGKPWPYAVHQRGSIEPGVHTMRCGVEIKFEIRAGTVFHFDYWGP